MARRVARAVVRIGHKRGATKKEIVSALETGIVESGLRNLRYGDRDSEGWRQERKQFYKNPTNLKASINRYYDETKVAGRGRGMTAGQLSQRVQRSAFPERYDQQRGRARRLYRQLSDGKGSSGGSSRGRTRTIPGVDRSGDRKAAIASYLLGSSMPGVEQGGVDDSQALLNSVIAVAQAKDTPARKVRVDDRQDTGGKRGKVRISPTADRPGAHTKRGTIRFAKKVAGRYGHPLTVGTGTNHSRTTTSGNVSEHWSGHAVDIPLSGAALTRAGRAALIAAGMPKAQARKAKGGIYNVGNHQIIFNTTQGGNHWNHLHISTH